jgi:hypothetical protein
MPIFTAGLVGVDVFPHALNAPAIKAMDRSEANRVFMGDGYSNAMFQRHSDRVIVGNHAFLDVARALTPPLVRHHVRPLTGLDPIDGRTLGKGDSCVLDFGTHLVGHLSLRFAPVGSPPDAPLHVRLIFGETRAEIDAAGTPDSGWLSSSWIQEDTFHVDVLPADIDLPRRYAFRYVRVDVLDTSPKYRVRIERARAETVSAVDAAAVAPLPKSAAPFRWLDDVSLRTLQNCMHGVFEDGPKRDRRLWLGDLRLQALVNYETFRLNTLVKRCLYLFAAVPDERGRIAASLFVEPEVVPDDTYLFDYSLAFVTVLRDYFAATGDRAALQALWPSALRQLALALESLDRHAIVRDADGWWSFVDWHVDLNKQAASHAILVATLRHGAELAAVIDPGRSADLLAEAQRLAAAARDRLWDPAVGFFVSGAGRQVSAASQVWMALAEVLEPRENAALLRRLRTEPPAIGLRTPYAHHFLVDALLRTGEREAALAVLESYWGGMLKHGADTFWEVFDPSDPTFSPYGSLRLNSYCHAWSCTPAYFIRKGCFDAGA